MLQQAVNGLMGFLAVEGPHSSPGLSGVLTCWVAAGCWSWTNLSWGPMECLTGSKAYHTESQGELGLDEATRKVRRTWT